MKEIYNEDGVQVTVLKEGHVYNVKLEPEADTLNLAQNVMVTFQDGAVKDSGRNGLTNESLLAILIDRTMTLNKSFHSEYNDKAIECMEQALEAFNDRTKDRKERNVEGTYVE